MSGVLYLIRHAQTEWTVSGQHTGHTDIPLTDRGREAATALGRALAGRTFSLVLTSPLSRARETCTRAGYGEQAQVREALREWDYGAYEGLTTNQIRRERPGWDVFRDGCPQGETAAQVGARVDAMIAEATGAGGDVAVFAHGHCLRVLGARWVGLDAAQGALIALSPGSISVLGHERERPVIRLWNQVVGTA
ncbi:MAG TPA: histidine phosphatase family protein [Solirubrobacteraceae bacterium]|jgi:probable phosphoglycerate mutase|nr:histidine phosphatase family protein [Solirubrobacteraceae bacterium]